MDDKYNLFVIFKAQFAAKMQHMKSNGFKLTLLERTECWIEDNIDKLWEAE